MKRFSPDQRTPGSLSSGSGFERLSPELQAVASRRLRVAAFVFGAVWVILFLAYWSEAVLSAGKLVAPDVRYLPRVVFAVVLSAGLLAVLRRVSLEPSRFLFLALLFEVLGALLIASGWWGWESRIAGELAMLEAAGADMSRIDPQASHIFRYSAVDWVGIWLLCFPLIVPMPPRVAVVTAFGTALTVPLVIFTSVMVRGMPVVAQSFLPIVLFDAAVPVLIAAGIAGFVAHVIYRLSRDLSKARELGSYRLEELIGAGGMGEVWRARHRMLVRPAAIKLIRAESLGLGGHGERSLRRFEREAQATAGLRSPHTIELYDFGVAPDGTFYYVMELLDGIDLKTLVERFGPVPAPRAVHLLGQVCHSLLDAHQRGLIHRDVKPANIFTCRWGPDYDFVKVLDFGLVKETQQRPESQLTMEGTMSGTPAFMAPEAAMGSESIDPRSDLYSLGCVAYWLVTGSLVFEGGTPMEVLVQHAREAPDPPSQRSELPIPESLDRLILQCLEKDPDRRPQSVLEVRRRLLDIERTLTPWTDEDGEQWWRMHAPQLATGTEPRRREEGTATSQTIETF